VSQQEQSIAEWLQGGLRQRSLRQPAPVQPEERDEIADWLNGGVDPTDRIRNSVKNGNTIEDELAGRIIKMQTKTPFPPEFIAKNLKQVEHLANLSDFDAEKPIWRPAVLKYIEEHPFYENLSPEKLKKLNNLGRFFERHKNEWSMPPEYREQLATRNADRLVRIELEEAKRRHEQGGDPIFFSRIIRGYTRRPYVEPTKEDVQRLKESYLRQQRDEIEWTENFIAKDDPIGALESFDKRMRENPLFAVPFLDAAPDLIKAANLLAAAEAVEEGRATQDQADDLIQYGRIAMAMQRRGQSMWGITANIIVDSVKFGVELAATSGIGTATKQAIIKGGTKAAEGMLRKSVQKALQSRFVTLTGRGVASLGGLAAMTLATRPIHIAKNVVGELTPEGYIEMENGDTAFKIVPHTGEKPFFTTLGKGFLREYAEVASEYLSTVPLVKKFDTAFNKLFDKAMFGFRKLKIGSMPSEFAEEELNRWILHAGGVETYRPPTGKEVGAQAIAFSFIPLLGSIAGAIGPKIHNRQIADPAPEEVFRQMGDAAKEAIEEYGSKAVEDFAKDATRDTGYEFLYGSVEDFDTHFQEVLDENGNKFDPREVAREVFGSTNEYDDAKRTDRDLQIPVSRYLVTLANTEHNEFFQDKFRFRAEESNAAERKEIEDDEKQRIADAKKGEVPEHPAPVSYREISETETLEAEQAADPPPRGQPTNEQIKASTAKVQKAVVEDLKKLDANQVQALSKISDPDIDVIASIVANRYRVRAMAQGADPLRLFERERIRWSTEGMSGRVPNSTMLGQSVFFQPEKRKPPKGERFRGRTRLEGAGFDITLFPNADPSTFIHELGHVWLVEMGRDIASVQRIVPESRTDAQNKLLADADTVLAHFGVDTFDGITREHSEQWARMTEVYFREGRAPSGALRKAFRRFRLWLIEVYRNITSLGVRLTPEVRDVMDRMLATEEEIALARGEQNQIRPFFPGLKAVGMTEKQAQEILELEAEADRKIKETLQQKLMDEDLRKRDKQWRDDRKRFGKEIAEKDLNQRTEYIALFNLQKGTLPDGTELPEDGRYKLMRSAIPKDIVKKLPKGVTAKEGILPDQAAELFGYRSGEELLDALITAPTYKGLLERLVTEKMREEHGDLLTDGRLPDEALKAIHIEENAEVLRRKLKWMTTKDFAKSMKLVEAINRPVKSLKEYRVEAQKQIRRMEVRKIKPHEFLRAERRAAKKAQKAIRTKNQVEVAFLHKEQELLNHELYRAAVEGLETAQKTLTYARSFEGPLKRKRIGKVDKGQHLQQIDGLWGQVDLRKRITADQQARKKTLAEWASDRRAEGKSPFIPTWVLSEASKRHWKDMRLEELLEIRDVVQQVETYALNESSLIAGEELLDFELGKQEIIGEIDKHHDITQPPADITKSLKSQFFKGVSRLEAFLVKPEFLFEFLDGEKPQGPVWKAFFRPFAKAEDAETEDIRAVTAKLGQLFSVYKRKELRGLFTKKIFLPGTKTRKFDGNFTKANMLMVALHSGNLYNFEAMLEGYGWMPDQVTAIHDQLDARDWAVVEEIWKYIDTFWPRARDLEISINGQAPDKVEAMPFNTKNGGTVAGGYFPLIFDGDLSWRQQELDERASVEDLFGGPWGFAMTRHQHLKRRENSGGKPPLLDMSALTDHLATVIHDITHRKAVIDAWKLINDRDIQETISAAAGRSMVPVIKKWVQHVAGDRIQKHANPFERIMARARTGAAIVNLGFRITSGVLQNLGFGRTLAELGPKYSSMGVRNLFGHGQAPGVAKMWRFITERSPMMRDRMKNYDRDIRDITRGLGIVPDMKKAFFVHIGVFDLIQSTIAWNGAYHKAMDGNVQNIRKWDEIAAIEYADRTVRVSQAAGSAKDLAAAQQGSESWKIWVMFYSEMSIQINQYMKTARQFRLEPNVPHLIGNLAALWFLPAVAEELIRGRPPDEDEAFLPWLLRKEIMYPLDSLLFVRDLANATDWYIETGKVEAPRLPIIDAMKTALYGLATTGKLAGNITGLTEDAPSEYELKQTAMGVGYAVGLPTRQLWLSGEYLHDVITGEQDPDNPVEFMWRSLVTGKPKE
jgi:hypothetical protein